MKNIIPKSKKQLTISEYVKKFPKKSKQEIWEIKRYDSACHKMYLKNKKKNKKIVYLKKSEIPDVKKCCTCGKELANTKENFHSNKRFSDKLSPSCKECCNKKISEYRSKNPRDTNKENIKYGVKNPISYILSHSKSYAKCKGLKFNLDKNFLKELWDRQGGKCHHSGVKMDFIQRSSNIHQMYLDRIDYQLGYTKDNVVFCSTSVKYARRRRHVNEIDKIVEDIRNV